MRNLMEEFEHLAQTEGEYIRKEIEMVLAAQEKDPEQHKDIIVNLIKTQLLTKSMHNTINAIVEWINKFESENEKQ